VRCVLRAGGFWVSEFSGNYVRWVSPAGIISTVAGIGGSIIGTIALGVWNGPATSARFNNPVFIVPDGSGGALFSDCNLNAVQRLLPNGTVSTVNFAGTGLSGTTGA
jgi:hypothetical protein